MEERRRRLVTREIAEGEEQREALAVARADRAGVVDGVLVDFRHPSIPPGEWEAREFWHVGALGNQHCGFLFPGEASYCDNPPNGERDDLLEEKRSLPRALPGDRLTVEGVIDRVNDRRFDHDHDATVKEASLILTRSTGEVVRPSSPMNFYGVTQLRDGPTRDAYDRLAHRILAEHGWPDAEKHETGRRLRGIDVPFVPGSELDLRDRAALAIERAEQAWHRLVDGYLGDDPRAGALLRTAMGEAVRAAFFQAKHELRSAEKVAARVAEGGSRRKARARDNRLLYAQGIWSVDPYLKISGLAPQVIEQLITKDGVEPMTTGSMVESLKAACTRGDLIIPPESPDHPDKRG